MLPLLLAARKMSTRERPRVVSSPLRPRVERKRGLLDDPPACAGGGPER